MRLLQQRMVQMIDEGKVSDQSALARYLGIHQSRVSKVLSNPHMGLSVPSAFKLAELTGEDPLVVMRYCGQGKIAALMEKWCAARCAIPRVRKGQRTLSSLGAQPKT